jgi:uncharacterized LabA/DUF88 family protein
MLNRLQNIAFIDGQNLHLGTRAEGWTIDYQRLRKYLKDKYDVIDAYYFLGAKSPEYANLYSNLRASGYQLCFREHSPNARGAKKGNVDSDIIFEAMKRLVENTLSGKILIVSGDGDYKKLVDYFIQKDRFSKILFPNGKFASSLYKSLGNEYSDALGREAIRIKLKYRK